MTVAYVDHIPSRPFGLSAVATAGSPLDRLLTFANLELHSLFLVCLLVCGALVLAHITNPTEASFRAFVTELALRRHITKLNGGGPNDVQATASVLSQFGARPTSPTPLPTPPPSAPIGPGFHFSNRANVSLRTPDHIFRSFLFFTIVIITPLANDHHPGKEKGLKPAAALEGSWYIGALSHWWIGGTLEFPHSRKQIQKDLLGKEEESHSEFKSGVLSIRSLDQNPTGAAPPAPSVPLIKNTPVKASKVNRRRSVVRRTPGNASDDETVSRSTTPPPLPKSASLPLHSTRMPPSTPQQTGRIERVRITPGKPSTKPIFVDSSHLGSHSHRPSHSTAHVAALDQHPSVIEALKDIRSTQSSLADLQGQLSSVTNSAAIQHQGLQETLQDCREKKIQDDQARIESKARMKSLEDSRQATELSKRAVEKRLKGVQAQHDLVLGRIEQLETEVQQLQKTMAEDEGRVVKSGIELSAYEGEMGQKMQSKRDELKLAEEVADALEKRLKELQDSIQDATSRLTKAKADAEERHKQRAASLQHQRGGYVSGPAQLRQPPSAMGIPPSLHIQPSPRLQTDQAIQPPNTAARGPGSFNFAPSSNGPRQPTAGLLQRRNIPSTAEPEPLQIPPSPNISVPSIGELPQPNGNSGAQRPRAMSLAGNVAVTVETSGAPGFTAVSGGCSSRGGSSVGLGAIGRGGPGVRGPGVENVSPPSSIYTRRASVQSQHRAFAPFSDSDSSDSLATGHDDTTSLSTFATSLLPTSLVKSMDAGDNSPSLDGSSLPCNSFDSGAQAYGNGYVHRREGSWSNFDLGPPVGDNSNGHPQQFSPHSAKFSTPDFSISSPVLNSSPDSHMPPGGRFANRFEVTSRRQSFGSPMSGSQPAFDSYSSGMTPMETLDEEKATKYRRWFPSFINSQAAQIAISPNQMAPVSKPKNKSGLNPDAQAFSFSRSRSSLLNGSSGSLSQPDANIPSSQGNNASDQAIPSQSSFASRMYGSLTHGLHHRHTSSSSQDQQQEPLLENDELAAPSTPTGNFFTSLLAFAPSPAERQALQRGLETRGNNTGPVVGTINGSGSTANGARSLERLPMTTAVSPFASPLPSAQTSAVELLHPSSAISAPWDRDIQANGDSSAATMTATTAPVSSSTPSKSSPAERRSFSSLWLRSKASKSNTSLTEVAEKDGKGGAGASTTTAAAAENDPPAFGSRFALFTRQKTLSMSESSPSKDM